MCFRRFFSFCDMQNLHRRARSLVTFGGVSRTCHSNSSERTVEVTGVDIKPADCSGRPQFDDRPVPTPLSPLRSSTLKTLTSHGGGCVAWFPSHHRERRSDQIALSGSLQAV